MRVTASEPIRDPGPAGSRGRLDRFGGFPTGLSWHCPVTMALSAYNGPDNAGEIPPNRSSELLAEMNT